MAIDNADFAAGQILTAERLNQLVTALNAHPHDGEDGVQISASNVATGLSGQPGAGTGYGSNVMEHIKAKGGGTQDATNPHGLSFADIDPFTALGSYNTKIIWMPASACNVYKTVTGATDAIAAMSTTSFGSGLTGMAQSSTTFGSIVGFNMPNSATVGVRLPFSGELFSKIASATITPTVYYIPSGGTSANISWDVCAIRLTSGHNLTNDVSATVLDTTTKTANTITTKSLTAFGATFNEAFTYQVGRAAGDAYTGDIMLLGIAFNYISTTPA